MRIERRALLWAALAMVLLQGRLYAQSTYGFLRGDVSPRIAALGGAFLSMSDDPNSLFVNPAAISTITSDRAAFSYLDHLLDISAGSIAFATPNGPFGPLAVGATFYSYGSWVETDASTNESGTFSAIDLALTAGSAYALNDVLTVGGSVEFISSTIASYQSYGLALSAGGLYTIPEERIAIGITLLHLGAQIKTYAGTAEDLPTDLRVGITKRPEHLPVYLNLNFHRLNDDALSIVERVKQYSFGAEFDLSSSLKLRLGFNNRLRRDLKLGTSSGMAGFSAGAGVAIRTYRIDYAFNSYGAIGGLHRIGVSAEF